MYLASSPHPTKLDISLLNILIEPFRNSPDINLLLLVVHQCHQSLLGFNLGLKFLIGGVQEQLMQLFYLHRDLQLY